MFVCLLFGELNACVLITRTCDVFFESFPNRFGTDVKNISINTIILHFILCVLKFSRIFAVLGFFLTQKNICVFNVFVFWMWTGCVTDNDHRFFSDTFKMLSCLLLTFWNSNSASRWKWWKWWKWKNPKFALSKTGV